jgi:Protein of unknown function (DUF3040)
MALSMDEQRVLAEIERRLAAEDPGLAACLTAFRRPGPATVLRSPRARIIGSLFTVLLVAMVSLMVYAMIPFRGHGARPAETATTASTTPATLSQSHSNPPESAGPSSGTRTRASSSDSPAAPPSGAAAGNGQASKGKAASRSASPTVAGPLPGAANDSRQSWTRYRSSPSSFLFSCWNSSLSGLRCRSNNSA